MRKFLSALFLLFVLSAKSQLLSWSPDFIQETSTPVIITMDATKGNQGLLNYTPATDVYVHIGAITSKSTSAADWKYSKFTWGTTNILAQCTYLGSNKWKYTITGGLKNYFGISDVTETIKNIAILFRNGDGSKAQRNADGGDMYISVYDNSLHVRIDDPLRQPYYNPIPEPVTKTVGDALSITAKASTASTIKIYFNATLISTANAATTATANTTISTTGNQQIIAEATSGANVSRDTVNFIVVPTVPVVALPAGLKDGINYDANNTSATLVLFAPLKKNVFVVGDFNNWTTSVSYLMNVTPDKQRFWIRINGLTPGAEYAYQYLIDGTLKVADYNTEKILDPANDTYIPAATYPNLKAYPTGKTTDIVSVLQTAKPAYNWQAANFTRPDKRNLIIYELLVRDFIAAQNWQTLKDTLGYLKRLGINAIEVMPFNEFEGNNSWGYNPSFYFAPDKAYGTETALKQFIDECHEQGMAVIMDMVLNHSFGQSPMVQMYWDAANNRPAADNPWFNPVAKHAYNVGYDFNHQSQATKDFVDRVLQHWLTNYHIDGYRFDLAKGFTQTQTCDANGGTCNVDAWGNYDASRVALWKRIYDKQQSFSPNSYCILEMFADNTEEKLLSDYGMMLWGNLNYNFNEATLGYIGNSNFNWGIYTTRGWVQPALITYQESHDEERLMYKNEQYGNNSGAYNVKTISTGLKRNAMATAFWAMIPGPKMLWQFGELGYDFSINTCTNGTVDPNGYCRLDPKPLHWEYYQNTDRKALYNVYAALFKLRNKPNYLSTFTTGAITSDLASSVKWLTVTSDSLKIIVFGNFDVIVKPATINFPNTGAWYSYLTDSVTTLTNTTQNVTLQPGEYYVFTSKNARSIALPVTLLSFTAQTTNSHSVLLKWSATNEINNDHYEIQRSANGITYMAIDNVTAGKNTSLQQYEFIDQQPLKGISYYRLKQVDRDGRFQYSFVAKINMQSTTAWQVYPNSGSRAALHIQSDVNQLQLTLTDATGKVIFRKIFGAAVSGQTIPIPLTNLTKGVYLLKVSTGKQSTTEKLLIN